MHLPKELEITYIQRHYTQKPLDFKALLKPLCKVTHLDELVYIFHHLPLFTETILITDINIFKTPIKPLWEDEKNVTGGKYIIKLKKGVGQRLFERLVIAFAVHDDNINGIVASIRSTQVILSVWCDTTQNNLDFVKRVRRMLDVNYEIPIEYKDNDESLKDNSSFRNTAVFGKVDTEAAVPAYVSKMENLSVGKKVKDILLDTKKEAVGVQAKDVQIESVGDTVEENINVLGEKTESNVHEKLNDFAREKSVFTQSGGKKQVVVKKPKSKTTQSDRVEEEKTVEVDCHDGNLKWQMPTPFIKKLKGGGLRKQKTKRS